MLRGLDTGDRHTGKDLPARESLVRDLQITTCTILILNDTYQLRVVVWDPSRGGDGAHAWLNKTAVVASHEAPRL